MNNIDLFLRDIEKLKTLKDSNDWYEILESANLVYRLLFDSPSQADTVNNTLNPKNKIVFTIIKDDIPDDPSLIFTEIADGLDPDTSPPFCKPIILNKNELYKVIVMKLNNLFISIGSLVKFLRNVQGGTHKRSPKPTEAEEVLLDQIQKELKIGGHPAGLLTMKALARVVYKALLPLYERIKTERE